MIGKKTRLGRIIGNCKRTVIVPMDQSITSGPIHGLNDMGSAIRAVSGGKPNAILMQRGPVMAGLWEPGCASALIVHLSAGTQLSEHSQVKTLVCRVEEAIQLGADAVSIHVSLGLGSERDNHALSDMSHVSDSCHRWGMPLLAMMYVYGKEHDQMADAITHAARIGADLGADLVKVNYTGDPDSFERLVTSCYVPIVVAGGDRSCDGLGTLQKVEIAMQVGACGVCIGRNVYQHANPDAMGRALASVVHHGSSAIEAYDQFILTEPGLDATALEARQIIEFARESVHS